MRGLKLIIGSLSSYNCGVKLFLCVIDAFTEYAGVNLSKMKRLKQFFMVLMKL